MAPESETDRLRRIMVPKMAAMGLTLAAGQDARGRPLYFVIDRANADVVFETGDLVGLFWRVEDLASRNGAR